jgi:hypothetical protein
MIDTSRERLIRLSEFPAPAIPGRGMKPINPRTLRSWCASGVRGIRLESVKIQGKHWTSIEAWNRFFQAVTAASATTTWRGTPPIVVSSRTYPEHVWTLREEVAALRLGFRRLSEGASNGPTSRPSVRRFSSPVLEALALERLPHRQLKILLALESLTRDRFRCFPDNRDFARLTAMSVRSLKKALADLVDQLRDMTRTLEESGKHDSYNK